MTTSYAVDQSAPYVPFGFTEFMMLFNSAGAEERSLFSDMLSKAKQQYVLTHHKQAISQLHSADKHKDGVWKTHVYVDGKRKTLQRKTEEELLECLYDIYKSSEEITTLEDVFNMLIQHKESLGRTQQTINEDKRRFGYRRKQPINKETFVRPDTNLPLWQKTNLSRTSTGMPMRKSQKAH